MSHVNTAILVESFNFHICAKGVRICGVILIP
jgi:hypothetical protein